MTHLQLIKLMDKALWKAIEKEVTDQNDKYLEVITNHRWPHLIRFVDGNHNPLV